MKTDLKTLYPWPELSRDLLNMTSLVIVADGEVYDGEADVTLDPDTRRLTITVNSSIVAKNRRMKAA